MDNILNSKVFTTLGQTGEFKIEIVNSVNEINNHNQINQFNFRESESSRELESNERCRWVCAFVKQNKRIPSQKSDNYEEKSHANWLSNRRQAFKFNRKYGIKNLKVFYESDYQIAKEQGLECIFDFKNLRSYLHNNQIKITTKPKSISRKKQRIVKQVHMNRRIEHGYGFGDRFGMQKVLINKLRIDDFNFLPDDVVKELNQHDIYTLSDLTKTSKNGLKFKFESVYGNLQDDSYFKYIVENLEAALEYLGHRLYEENPHRNPDGSLKKPSKSLVKKIDFETWKKDQLKKVERE